MINERLTNFFKSELQSKITKGIIWTFLGTIISRGFLFISYIFISNVTTLHEYGQIGIIKSSITTFSLFSLASFGITATRFISLYLEKDKQKTERILTLSFCLTVLLSLLILISINIFKQPFSSIILGSENLKPTVIFVSITIFFAAINGFQNGALAGFEQFKSIAIVNIVFGLLSLPILYFGTKLYGVIGFCYAMLLIYFVLFACSAYFLNKAMIKKVLKFKFKEISKELFEILYFSIPSFLGGAIVSPTILICNAILVKSQNGFLEMGIYDAAFNFSIIAMTLNGIAGQVLYPYAMKTSIKGNPKFDYLNMNIPWLVGVFFGLILIYLPDLLALIFDKDFHNSKMYFTLSTIALFIIFISHRQGMSRNLAALNKMWYGFFDNLIWAIIAIVSTYFLVFMGSFGRALAFVVAYLLNSIIVLPFYLKLNIFQKAYVFSLESTLIWLTIILSYITIFFDFNIFIRILFLVISFITISLISIHWYKKMIKIC
jgi:O-antigen/teichoic acid export membrane protein